MRSSPKKSDVTPAQRKALVMMCGGWLGPFAVRDRTMAALVQKGLARKMRWTVPRKMRANECVRRGTYWEPTTAGKEVAHQAMRATLKRQVAVRKRARRGSVRRRP